MDQKKRSAREAKRILRKKEAKRRMDRMEVPVPQVVWSAS